MTGGMASLASPMKVLVVILLFFAAASAMEEEPFQRITLTVPPRRPNARPMYDPLRHWGIIKTNNLLFKAGDGSTFIVNGWNTRDLMYNCLTASGRARAFNLIRQAKAMGLTVVRVMVCNDGTGFPYVQPGPTVFNETILRALDYLADESAKLGIRLLPVLGNNWESKAQFAHWLKLATGNNRTVPDDFFRHTLTKQWYKLFVAKIVNRRNTISRRLYKEDPVIFAWELFNEPRCVSDPTGNDLSRWLAEMAQYIKTIDRNHMVTSGVEGFYGHSDRSRLQYNPSPVWPGNQGNDFLRENAINAIDFATLHLYPTLWKSGTLSQRLTFCGSWIRAHVDDIVGRIRKPMVIEEFGWQKNLTERYEFFKVVYRESDAAIKRRQLAGTMFWALEDYNGFFSDWGVYHDRDLRTTVKLISDSALEVNKMMPAP